MGSKPSSQTVTNKADIDPVTQAWRSNLMGQTNALAGQGVPNYYPGQTVVPFSQQTQSGMDYLQGHAQQGATNLGAANASAQRGLSGWNPAMPAAANAAMGGLNNQQLGGLQQFGGGVNPALDSLWQTGSRQVSDAVNGQMMKAGRFGPNAAHTGALTQGLGDLWGQVYAPAYEAERNRGLSAAGQLAGYGDANANRQLQGAELIGSMWSQGNADAARQQALLPSLFSYGQMPGQAMLDLGGMYDDQAGRYIADDKARYDYQANAPWDQLQRQASIFSGLPDFSSTTQTSTGAKPNRIMEGIGAAASIASLFSDRRLKRDAWRVGVDARGNRWWEYRYIWDEPSTRRLGVMADEAPAHAVALHPSGFAMVDYGAL